MPHLDAITVRTKVTTKSMNFRKSGIAPLKNPTLIVTVGMRTPMCGLSSLSGVKNRRKNKKNKEKECRTWEDLDCIFLCVTLACLLTNCLLRHRSFLTGNIFPSHINGCK